MKMAKHARGRASFGSPRQVLSNPTTACFGSSRHAFCAKANETAERASYERVSDESLINKMVQNFLNWRSDGPVRKQRSFQKTRSAQVACPSLDFLLTRLCQRAIGKHEDIPIVLFGG